MLKLSNIKSTAAFQVGRLLLQTESQVNSGNVFAVWTLCAPNEAASAESPAPTGGKRAVTVTSDLNLNCDAAADRL